MLLFVDVENINTVSCIFQNNTDLKLSSCVLPVEPRLSNRFLQLLCKHEDFVYLIIPDTVGRQVLSYISSASLV